MSRDKHSLDVPKVVRKPKLTHLIADSNIDTQTPSSLPEIVYSRSVPEKQLSPTYTAAITKQNIESSRMLREQCSQLCISLFFRRQEAVRSLGFTSSLNSEGKSLVARVMADVLAHDIKMPVTLLECNWEHPCLHEYFGLTAGPGLAEWLRGECTGVDVCCQVSPYLTVIPAGNGKQDAVKLLNRFHQQGRFDIPSSSGRILIVDLPSLITTAYGPFAASLVDSLVVVVRAGIANATLIAEACTHLKDLNVHGMLLNQVESRIPRWLQRS